MQRQAGVLLPIFSIPNKYGIGSFGNGAYKFIDFLKQSGQKVWQILPLVQTGYGNSPYSSVCSYSYNPYFIDLEKLVEQKLLTKAEISISLNDSFYIDYGFLYNARYPLLQKAYARFNKNTPSFKRFIKEKNFLNYALYMTIKQNTNFAPLSEWEKGLKDRDAESLNQYYIDNYDTVTYWQFIQYIAEKQWFELKKYANKKGIKIMGDIPYYVAGDSVDVWVNPKLYKLDENLNAKKVAGVPPDYFCQTGQLWGNPVYDYEVHKLDGYRWWGDRISQALTMYDYIRIDHFRAFDRYYEIEAGAENAINGTWVNANGKEIIDSVHKGNDGGNIIAEDLGIIDDGVRSLLAYAGYPGMKILSFAFDGHEDNLYLPQNITENYVCYTGTHDNDTLIGLITKANFWDKANLVNGVQKSLKLLGIKGKAGDYKVLAKQIIELGYASKANLFILPMQDLLNLSTEYRINEPGTVKEQNWAIRLTSAIYSQSNAKKLLELTKKYDR